MAELAKIVVHHARLMRRNSDVRHPVLRDTILFDGIKTARDESAREQARQSSREEPTCACGVDGSPACFLRRPPSRQASRAAQDDAALAYYRQAKINWRQAEGQSLTIGLNKHPFTESLLPLIPEFRR